jgi:hypothetical protein
MMRWMIQSILLVLMPGCVPAIAVMKSGPLEAFVVGGTDRVGWQESPRGADSIELYAAKGEYEPFQIVVRGAQDLNGVQVSVSELKGPNGAIIGKQNIRLYRQHFVTVRYGESSPSQKGSNRAGGPGLYADALIPFEAEGRPVAAATPFAVRAGTNQPVWVDVWVPRNAVAGQYRGSFKIVHGRDLLEGSLSLRVWNFELPLQPSLRSLFQYWTEKSLPALELLLQHKLMPERIPLEYQKRLSEQFGLTMVGLSKFSGANYQTCRMDPPPSVESFKELKDRQLAGLLVYNYTADEIDNCPNLLEPLKAWSRNLRAAGVKNLLVMTPSDRLFDDGTGNPAGDIWVVCPGMYERGVSSIAEAQRRGLELWSYNALVNCFANRALGDVDYPAWQIDFSPLNFRIHPGFINQSLGLKGLLYWRIDYWSSDPWNDVNQYCRDVGSCRGYGFPGDGMMVYPGKQVGLAGVVPSLRLKWLREGVEDYEYIEILKKLGRSTAALEVSRSVARDWTNWTKDAGAVESARRRLGEMIEQMKR